MKNNTVFTLAMSKLRFHKSRTLLTGIAIFLTTTLLMGIGTSGIAMLDMNRQYAQARSNYHAAFYLETPEQLAALSNHISVESMASVENFATIINGKMNGFLSCYENVKNGLYFDNLRLAEGCFPEKEDEICSLPAFFERVGAEPVIGGKVTLSFRVNGKGELQTKEFTICGLLPDKEITSNIDDSRIAWGAYISQSLLESYEQTGAYQLSCTAYLRVYGEENLNYTEITDKIKATAADIGLNEEFITLDKQYLYTMTDPGTETMSIVAGICFIVILFSALVIYSIYYVSVITDIQEIGKLKALGASKRQIARLFFWQGNLISAFAIPAGLLVGFFLPYFLFPFILRALGRDALDSAESGYMENLTGKIHMFSLPLLLTVILAMLFTVWISLLKPIRMAKKVSPVEAIRYQENTGSKKLRKGHREIKVTTLTLANLTRNKRRTTVTILTMGLSCVLFICASAVLSSTSAKDIARRNIPEGEFRIALDYSLNDKEYPENNLENLVQQNFFSDAFLTQLSDIKGVEKVERAHGKISSSSDGDSALYHNNGEKIYLTFSYFTREDLQDLSSNLIYGDIDYDRMTANREVLCTHEYTFNECALALGDTFPLTLYDGSREVPLTVTLTALTQPNADYSLLVITEDLWNSLGLTCEPTTDIYLHVEDKQYDSVKKTLADIVAENPHFTLYSLDEEMQIGRSSVSLIKYPAYLILVLIAVISFMNLINTMITSIVTRKKELGILQAVGLSNRQLVRMLSGEGFIFTAGTLLISVTLGNILGYLLFLYAKKTHFMSLSRYHYPLWETICLALILLIGQSIITLFISKKIEKESLIERIRNDE